MHNVGNNLAREVNYIQGKVDVDGNEDRNT